MDILKNFGIQPTLLLAQIVNFAIILFLLKRFFYKPITKALDDRKKRIEESLKNADLIEEKLEKTQKESSEIIASAQKNAQDLISEAKSQSQIIIEQANQQARQNLEEALVKAKDQIEDRKQEIKKQLEKETITLVVEVVKKVLGRSLKTKEKHELTLGAVSEIKKQIQ